MSKTRDTKWNCHQSCQKTESTNLIGQSKCRKLNDKLMANHGIERQRFLSKNDVHMNGRQWRRRPIDHKTWIQNSKIVQQHILSNDSNISNDLHNENLNPQINGWTAAAHNFIGRRRRHSTIMWIMILCIGWLTFSNIVQTAHCVPSRTKINEKIDNNGWNEVNERMKDNDIGIGQYWTSKSSDNINDNKNMNEYETNDNELTISYETDEPDSNLKINDSNVCYSENCIDATGYLSNSMDLNVNPCDDFYMYTCGKWIRDHPIPLFVKSWSHFERVHYAIQADLLDKLKNKEKFLKATNNRAMFDKLYDFFHGCTNQTQRDISGYKSLYKLLNEIGGWPMIDEKWNVTLFEWEKAYVRLAKLDLYFFMRIEAMTELFDTSKTIIKIGPPYQYKENIINFVPQIAKRSSFTLFTLPFQGRRNETGSPPPSPSSSSPSVDDEPNSYYPSDELHNKYKNVISELKRDFTGTPINSSFDHYLDTKLDNIYKLQAILEKSAHPSLSLEDYRQNYSQYLYNITQLKQSTGLDFTYILEQMFPNVDIENQTMFVPDEQYLIDLGKLLRTLDKSEIANYLATNMVINIAGHSTTQMVKLLIAPLDAPEVLQNICFEETSRYLPELLGKLYMDGVAENSSKWQQDVNSLVQLLNDSFHEMLYESKWMDEATIKEAISKLDHMSMNVGYPEWYANDTQFEEYSKMVIFENKIDQQEYFSSVINVNEVSQELTTQELIQRLDEGHRGMLVSWPGHKPIIDVNAFYYFTANGVFIPVAIAQYPFYEMGLPKAITFGSMGMIIGHEMSHAFDNTGRLYDYDGNLRNWWSDQTSDGFRNKTDCFVKQYSNFVFDTIKQTLAENIADNGGLREAYRV
ncbi:hypothetical protein RDWZM_005309 [Blomia tropicalis]|uniref:Uncharacterized protein n=1 Tax=Blomia tropicalis TaxID=40697 RepID=A0A9Q0M8A7_BLOTA|nr:hypothetical protein RDWZM_005309 [Blomia tropicalis]